MVCQLCGEDKKLIKAHITPKCLNRLIQELYPAEHMIKISKKPGTYPKRTPAGEYDDSILCAACDNHVLGSLDTYAGELLGKKIYMNTITKYPIMNATQQYCIIPEYDYSSLKLFFLSVLWRMSVSTRPSFTKVNLGPYEAQIRDMLLRKYPGPPETFSIVLHRYIDDFCAHCMVDTQLGRQKDLKVYNMSLPGYLAIIKVDQRPIPAEISKVILRPNAPLIVILDRMPENREWGLIKRIVKAQKPTIRWPKP